MEPKFMISEVFGTSWKYTKSQIWVLVGLFIGYFILSSIISLFGMPAQGSMVGKIIVNLISAVISSAFMLGGLHKKSVPDNGWRRTTVFRIRAAIP